MTRRLATTSAALALALATTACTSLDSFEPRPFSSVKYDNLSCRQLATELAFVEDRLQVEFAKLQRIEARRLVIFSGLLILAAAIDPELAIDSMRDLAPGALFGFAISTATGNQNTFEAEISRLKGEKNALTEAMTGANCPQIQQPRSDAESGSKIICRSFSGLVSSENKLLGIPCESRTPAESAEK